MKKASLITVILMIMLSCNKHTLFEEFIQIPKDIWNSSNILKYNVNISDTASTYNLYINVRNVNRYAYSNLYLFVTAHSPDGNSMKDTIEIILADENGKWLGKGAASVYSSAYPYKTDIRFPVRGIYTFDIEQAMRVRDLQYISDVGLQIKDADNRRP